MLQKSIKAARAARVRLLKKIHFILLAAGSVTLVVSFLFILNTQSLISANKQVIVVTERFVSDMKDIETGYRGYVITSKDAYLVPLTTASTKYRETADELMREVLQAHGDGNIVIRLRDLAQRKIHFATTVVDAKRSGSNEALDRLIASGGGKLIMDEMRATAHDLQQQCQARIDRLDGSRMHFLYALVAIGLCLIVLTTLMARRSAARSHKDAVNTQRSLDHVINGAPVGIALVDNTGRIMRANPAFHKLIGAQQPFENCQLGDAAPAIEKALALDLRGALDRGIAPQQGAADNIIELQTPAGVLYVDASVFPLDFCVGEGAVARGAGIVAVDITRQREWERELENARDDANAANRAKSAFIANMSHELRTPLTAVLGYSELIEEELRDLGEESLLADLDKININARHLLGLINDVLDLSKIEAQKMDVSAIDFKLKDLVNEVAASVGSLIKKNKNNFMTDVYDDDAVLHTDDLKIKQILLNLISNSAKFTKEGSIKLSVAQILHDGRAFIRFTVSDTGIGMTEEQVANLFQRFTQADESTTRKFGGTGLGLALTRALSQILGGFINVTSTPGAGSQFVLEIPQTYQAESLALNPINAAREDGEGAEGPPVLVVDDDPAARDILRRLLTREGFSVRMAVNGVEALEQIRANPPAAVLLDVMLPGMDGWHVLKELRADPATANIPVIIQTVLDDSNFAYAMGASGFLKKPIGKNALAEALSVVNSEVAPEGYALIVDDDLAAVERIAEMLQRDGWSVNTASSGAEALIQMHKAPPALMLVDLVMPEMDGYALIRHIRANSDWDAVPIVVLTAEDISGKKIRDLALSTADIVQKGSRSLTHLVNDLRKFTARPHSKTENSSLDSAAEQFIA